MASRKRKYRSASSSHNPSSNSFPSTDVHRNPDPDPALFIQAYEADLVRGPQARLAAQSLEVVEDLGPSTSDNGKKRSRRIVGDGLIRWGGARFRARSGGGFGDDVDEEGEEGGDKNMDDDRDAVWVDRYDARLLLDALPNVPPGVPQSPSSPTGWSDVPSDVEDTFFFTPDETDEFRRDKRRRVIDRNREERLKAIRAAEGEDDEEEDIWGGSDEEPDEPQKELMRRTATHILSSPNPAQLEMRILANHGGDKRFAFLRGRWGHTWKVIKGKAKLEKQFREREIKTENTTAGGLGILSGYGDSDGGSDDEGDDEKQDEKDTTILQEDKEDETKGIVQGPSDEAVLKEMRRAKAREWAEKRRALKA